MRHLTTISGRKLKVTSNQSLRHFTIKTESGKYRTHKLSKQEFEQCELNTANDWQDYLKSDDYYKVK